MFTLTSLQASVTDGYSQHPSEKHISEARPEKHVAEALTVACSAQSLTSFNRGHCFEHFIICYLVHTAEAMRVYVYSTDQQLQAATLKKTIPTEPTVHLSRS